MGLIKRGSLPGATKKAVQGMRDGVDEESDVDYHDDESGQTEASAQETQDELIAIKSQVSEKEGTVENDAAETTKNANKQSDGDKGDESDELCRHMTKK